jgi:hypothetical protein
MKFQVDDEFQIRTCMEEVVAYLKHTFQLFDSEEWAAP